MNTEGRSFSALMEEVWRQLAVRQEDLDRQIGVDDAIVNCWENGHSAPSKRANTQLKTFCEKMIRRSTLTLSAGMMDLATLEVHRNQEQS